MVRVRARARACAPARARAQTLAENNIMAAPIIFFPGERAMYDYEAGNRDQENPGK